MLAVLYPIHLSDVLVLVIRVGDGVNKFAARVGGYRDEFRQSGGGYAEAAGSDEVIRERRVVIRWIDQRDGLAAGLAGRGFERAEIAGQGRSGGNVADRLRRRGSGSRALVAEKAEDLIFAD